MMKIVIVIVIMIVIVIDSDNSQRKSKNGRKEDHSSFMMHQGQQNLVRSKMCRFPKII